LGLASIRGVLDSDTPAKLLTLLLDEHAKQLGGEIKEKQHQLDAIKIVNDSLCNKDAIPVNTIRDIGHMMKNKKGLFKLRMTMILGALALELLELSVALLWVFTGIWLPFALGMPVVLLGCAWLTRMYYRKTAYLCPECNAAFKPTFKQFFFATHAPKTRKLTCTVCGHKGFCVEVLAENP